MDARFRRYLPILFFAAMALLFLVANRGAYEGYFQADDLDNLSWTRQASWSDFVSGIATPRFFPGNFRPMGHSYFYVMGHAAGLNFTPYVSVLHLFHLINAIALWLILRGLGIPPVASGCGVALFAFHMAVFDAYWRPMYIFDVLCACFSLLCILAYMHRHWIAGLAFLWLAYKSKEIAVMLPAALAVYEFTLGERKWKLLIPYFAVSVLFGLQGVLLNPNLDNDYTLRFTPEAIQTTASFYVPRLIPFGAVGFALLLVPFFLPDRRIWFGLAMCALLLFPMLLLPGRLYSVYLYLPLAGFAIAFAALVSRWHWAIGVLLIALWMPWNYSELRNYRRAALTVAFENKAYMQSLLEVPAKAPEARKFIYDGRPEALDWWGIQGALRLAYNAPVELKSIEDRDQFDSGKIALLTWDPFSRKIHVAAGSLDQPEASFITMNPETPVWQLKEGWYLRENQYRWIRPRATAVLYRPAGARTFQMQVNAGPQQIREIGRTHLTVLIDGNTAGEAEIASPTIHHLKWELAPAPAGPVTVEFRVNPEYRTPSDARVFGVPIVSFGFRLK